MVCPLAFEQIHLCQNLVRERSIHNPGRMTSGISQVNQPPFREQDDVILFIIASIDFVHLRFYFFPGPVVAHELGINLGVKVADVTNHGVSADSSKQIFVADFNVTCTCANEINIAHKARVDVFKFACVQAAVVWRNDLIAVHASLHGTDGIDFDYSYDHAFLSQAGSRTFTHITIADDQCFFTCHQHICAAFDGVV